MAALWTIQDLVVDSSTTVVESTQQGEKRTYSSVWKAEMVLFEAKEEKVLLTEKTAGQGTHVLSPPLGWVCMVRRGGVVPDLTVLSWCAEVVQSPWRVSGFWKSGMAAFALGCSPGPECIFGIDILKLAGFPPWFSTLESEGDCG